MSDPLVRLAVVAAVAAIVVVISVLTRRWQRPVHPPVAVAQLDLPAGVVVFTSTDCATCKDALAALRSIDLPVREVTWELERETLERAQIAAVPLTLFVHEGGRVIDQIVGVPKPRRLRRAVAAWEASR